MPNPTRAYKDFLRATSPGWLQGSFGDAWNRETGDVWDSEVDLTKKAVLSRFVSLAPYDGVAACGSERGMPQGPTEPLATYRGRLLNAWNAWIYAGTANGILQALFSAGYINCGIAVKNGIMYTLQSGTTPWTLVATKLPAGSWFINWDLKWNEFELIFFNPLYPVAWQSSVPSSTSGEANLIRGIISRWKPAHAVCDTIRIITSGQMWGWGLSTWGDGDTYHSTDSQTDWTP